MKNNSRWRNYGLWAAIFSLIPLILEGIGVNIIPKNYSSIISSILGILVLAGIINDPTTENKGFLDDKVETPGKDQDG